MSVARAARLRRCRNSAEGAGANDEIADRVDTLARPTPAIPQARPLRALLSGKNCTAAGITVSGTAPALGLCRALVQAGHHPDLPLHVFRGTTLAFVVRSIGEGARLTVEDDARGRPRFRLWRSRTDGAASPVCQGERHRSDHHTRRELDQRPSATLPDAERNEILVPATSASK